MQLHIDTDTKAVSLRSADASASDALKMGQSEPFKVTFYTDGIAEQFALGTTARLAIKSSKTTPTLLATVNLTQSGTTWSGTLDLNTEQALALAEGAALYLAVQWTLPGQARQESDDLRLTASRLLWGDNDDVPTDGSAAARAAWLSAYLTSTDESVTITVDTETGVANLASVGGGVTLPIAISDVTGLQPTLNLKAPLASPNLTGTPTAPTAASNTNTTQLATTAFVQGKINDLIGGAPGALDTLNELAAAMGNDAAFSATVTNHLADIDAALATKSNMICTEWTSWVSMDGNDATGVCGDPGKPFRTLQAAADACADAGSPSGYAYLVITPGEGYGPLNGSHLLYFIIGFGYVSCVAEFAAPAGTGITVYANGAGMLAVSCVGHGDDTTPGASLTVHNARILNCDLSGGNATTPGSAGTDAGALNAHWCLVDGTMDLTGGNGADAADDGLGTPANGGAAGDGGNLRLYYSTTLAAYSGSFSAGTAGIAANGGTDGTAGTAGSLINATATDISSLESSIAALQSALGGAHLTVTSRGNLSVFDGASTRYIPMLDTEP